jgi:hypothetical protein
MVAAERAATRQMAQAAAYSRKTTMHQHMNREQALWEALRRHAMATRTESGGISMVICNECKNAWSSRDEQHAAGCLVAPRDRELIKEAADEIAELWSRLDKLRAHGALAGCCSNEA